MKIGPKCRPILLHIRKEGVKISLYGRSEFHTLYFLVQLKK